MTGRDGSGRESLFPYLVVVRRKGQEPVISLTRSIAANDPMPRTPDEAKDRVLAYAGPLQDGDRIYVIPSDQVTVYKATGFRSAELEHEAGEPML